MEQNSKNQSYFKWNSECFTLACSVSSIRYGIYIYIPSTFDAELVPTGLVPDVEGTIEVTELDGGLQIELDAPSLPRRVHGAFYEGWLRLADDRLVPVGTFQTGIDVTLFAGIDLDDVTELVIALGEASPGDGARSGPDDVVLKADLPPAES